MLTKLSIPYMGLRTIQLLLVYRAALLLAAGVFLLRDPRQSAGLHLEILIFIVLCMYESMIALAYRQAMAGENTRLLLISADLMIACIVLSVTGVWGSPLLLYGLIPIFALQYVYRQVGLWTGLAVFIGMGLYLNGTVLRWRIQGPSRPSEYIVLVLTILVFYVLPLLALRRYDQQLSRISALEQEKRRLCGVQDQLLSLLKLSGRLCYEHTESSVFNGMIPVFKEVFSAERICIFLIRRGEVEVYGSPTRQEKENIYQLIVRQRQQTAEPRGPIPFYDAGTAMVPLMRGNRLDGVLSFHERRQTELSREEALLLTLSVHLLCTYLENLEYLDGLTASGSDHDSGVLMHQLSSGRPVKGRLDRRILFPSDH